VPEVQDPTRTASGGALRRELGRWDLTAIGVNQVIGASVFALPAALAGLVGGWSPLLILAVGFASLLIAATFAEVGSRFDGTGGPYLYTRAAFGRFAAFEVGWMQWFTRVASWASVINVLVASLGFYWPGVTTGAARIALMTAIIVALAIINVVGIRQSAWVVNTFAISKLIPLLLFIAFGLPAIDAQLLTTGGTPTLATVSRSALLLIFGFGGYEVIPVPAGEAKDPRRGVPFALLMTIVIVAIILTLVQIAALGTLPGLAQSKTPLTEASARVMGAAGAALITFGAVMSTTGNNMGQALSGSRALFALAEQGDLPRILARVSARFGTPVNAILLTAAISLVLAVTGTFVTMGVASAVSRLVVYVATCASTLRLRSPAFDGRVAPATLTLPLGPVVPCAAIAIALGILAGATALQLIGGAVALAAGAALFLIAAPPGWRDQQSSAGGTN
jgi:APA family basic amino acid/polyamine antiporter